MVFCAQIKHYRKKYLITEEQRALYLFNGLLVFSFQFLIFIIYLYDLSNKYRLNSDGFFFMVSFDVALARFCNAFLMHMLIEPEIRQAIRLWKFATNHVKVKSSMSELYMRTCGDRLPLPHDPAELTDELLS
jgi:hypothetical protein